jgi:hypothetical protein
MQNPYINYNIRNGNAALLLGRAIPEALFSIFLTSSSACFCHLFLATVSYGAQDFCEITLKHFFFLSEKAGSSHVSFSFPMFVNKEGRHQQNPYKCNITFRSCPRIKLPTYECVSKSFRTGGLQRELQMVQLFATRCSCIAVLSVSLVSFAEPFVLLLREYLLLFIQLSTESGNFWTHPRTSSALVTIYNAYIFVSMLLGFKILLLTCAILVHFIDPNFRTVTDAIGKLTTLYQMQMLLVVT